MKYSIKEKINTDKTFKIAQNKQEQGNIINTPNYEYVLERNKLKGELSVETLTILMKFRTIREVYLIMIQT